MTDLSRERLDELELFAGDKMGEYRTHPHATILFRRGELRALVAMAKRTEAAERERDALRNAVKSIVRFYDDSRAEPEYERAQTMDEMARAALAQPTTEGGE